MILKCKLAVNVTKGQMYDLFIYKQWYKKTSSFFPVTVQLCNKLPAVIKDLAGFMGTEVPPPKFYYYVVQFKR